MDLLIGKKDCRAPKGAVHNAGRTGGGAQRLPAGRL